MPEVMIPPWVRPENPERIALLDDGTQMFQPQFARGTTQVQIWADPRWQFTRRYRGMRSDQKAVLLSALSEARGKGVTVRLTPHTTLRGSFPASELLTNNTFENGTTGWTADATYTLTASDRILRTTRNSGAAIQTVLARSSGTTVTALAPYAIRFMIQQSRGSYSTGFQINDSGAANGALLTGVGLKTQVFVPVTTSMTPSLQDQESTGLIAGDYLQILYASLARCALADAGSNLVLRSQEFNTSWTTTNATISANSGVVPAPDSTSTADSLVEDSASGQHFVAQTVTVSSSALDYSFGCAVRAGSARNIYLELVEGTGGTIVRGIFNPSTGAVVTATSGANWSNERTFAVSLGNSWWAFYIVARKTNAATALAARVGNADGTTVSYTGDGSSNNYMWRATLAQSSVPTRLVHTTTAAVSSGTSQTGSGLHVKGLPASASGLLEVNDWFSFAGELKQVTARLNSDAAGLGYLQFRPSIGTSPADNTPIEIFEPWGRFRLMSGAEYDNMWGTYADAELEFSEVYE
jgi:hypothetical protein